MAAHVAPVALAGLLVLGGCQQDAGLGSDAGPCGAAPCDGTRPLDQAALAEDLAHPPDLAPAADLAFDCAQCGDHDPCTVDRCRAGDGGALGCRHVDATACVAACGPQAGCGFRDRDQDGLNDTWERNGYVDVDCDGEYDPAVDTPLPDAHLGEPDVYVKWDYLVKPGPKGHSHQPTAAAMQLPEDAFARHHSHLHYFPASDAIDERAVVTLVDPGALDPACTGNDAVSLYTLKAAHFPAALAPAYHYAVFAHYAECDSVTHCAACKGVNKRGAVNFGITGIAEYLGNDLLVAMGGVLDLGVDPVPDLVNAGTFLHELGHNLGLQHGGADGYVQKPQYFSVMNYDYAWGIGRTAQPGPFETSQVDPSVEWFLDYSDFAGGPLREGKSDLRNGCTDDGGGGLSEPAGVPSAPPDSRLVTVFLTDFGGQTNYAPSNGTPVDWDGRPPASDEHVFADVNGDGDCSVLVGYHDWAQSSPEPGVYVNDNLKLDFQCRSGNWADGPVASPGRLGGATEVREPTAEGQARAHRLYPMLHVEVVVEPEACAPGAPDRLDAGAAGEVTVAVVGALEGAARFVARRALPSSLRLAGAPALGAEVRDLDGDGAEDLVARFPVPAWPARRTSVDLVGALDDTRAFGARIPLLSSAASGPRRAR